MSMQCPDCKLLTMQRVLHDETEELDTGRGVIAVRCEKVPVDRCSRCHLITSGPAAAARRSDARCRALLAFIKEKLPPLAS